MKANGSNNYESWAVLCLGWLELICFKFLVYNLFWEQQLIDLLPGELRKEKHLISKMQVNITLANTGLETQILRSLPPFTPPQFLVGTPCLCIDNMLGNRVILLGLGRRFYSAPFPARQAILDGVIGEGCCRLSEGHLCLAAFLVQWLGTRRCPQWNYMAALEGRRRRFKSAHFILSS